MAGSYLRIAAGKRIEAKEVARERLRRIDCEDGLEMPACVRQMTGFSEPQSGFQMILDRAGQHHVASEPSA